MSRGDPVLGFKLFFGLFVIYYVFSSAAGDNQTFITDLQKTGTCPEIIISKERLSEPACEGGVSDCETDKDCDGELKCCDQGCVNLCTLPLYTGCQQLGNFLKKQNLDVGEDAYIPTCQENGEFEPIQCSNSSGKCWCVDEQGFELAGTRASSRDLINCSAPNNCADFLCRMLCPYGFALDDDGCPLCKCRNLCEDIKCPGGEECQLEEIPCSNRICPPLPTCKQPRTLEGLCPVGNPLTSPDSGTPFLCGVESNKPQCPPNYICDVKAQNDYGVCCAVVEKPGECPKEESHVFECGSECNMDMECEGVGKCCYVEGCGKVCRHPANSTLCLQQKAVVELLLSNNPGYEGYIPQCTSMGLFTPKQCSLNGQLCWCVDKNGTLIQGTMGPKITVFCISEGRTVGDLKCDNSPCTSECETGYRVDENGCRTCECIDPCEGFNCPDGLECILMKVDPCFTDYCQPVATCYQKEACSSGNPFSDNGQIVHCIESECPESYICEKSNGRENGICCPKPIMIESTKPGSCPEIIQDQHNCSITCSSDAQCESDMKCCPSETCGTVCVSSRPQTMCEYLYNIGHEMLSENRSQALAIPIPQCLSNGQYNAKQCDGEECWCVDEFGVELVDTREPEYENIDCMQAREDLRCLGLICRLGCDFGFEMNGNGCPLCICRNPCKSSKCAEGFSCHFVEINCKNDWCPPVPQCIPNPDVTSVDSIDQEFAACAVGSPMLYEDSNLPVVCDPLSKYPQCPSTHDCVLRSPHAVGMCCPRIAEPHEVLNSSTRKVESTKPGLCPDLITWRNDDCSPECQTDDHCPGFSKCCLHECGSPVCVNPHEGPEIFDDSLRVSESGKSNACPPYISWRNDDCSSECQVDEHCPSDTKCCLHECGASVCVEANGSRACPSLKCQLDCELQISDENGCPICACKNPCNNVICENVEERCHLMKIECQEEPCQYTGVCLPELTMICSSGLPLLDNSTGGPISCSNGKECPLSHKCQLSPSKELSVCCPKPVTTSCERIKDNNKKLAKDSNKIVFIPKCDKRTGAWEPIQCMESLGLCWCIDSDGNQLSGTSVRGVPHCVARIAKNMENLPICKNDKPVYMCPNDLCANKLCSNHKNATCRINPCGGCNAEFYDDMNNLIDCNEGLTACLHEKQDILNSRTWIIQKNILDAQVDNSDLNIFDASTFDTYSSPPPSYPPPPPPPLQMVSQEVPVLADYDYFDNHMSDDFSTIFVDYADSDLQISPSHLAVIITPQNGIFRKKREAQSHIFDISSHYTIINNAPVPLVKSGLCPVPSLLSIIQSMTQACKDHCLVDSDCPGNTKCCVSRCGLDCTDPIRIPLNTDPKPGLCPAILESDTNRFTCLFSEKSCIFDEGCPENKKCCATICGHRCLTPEENPLQPAFMILAPPKCSIQGGYAVVQIHGDLSWCVDKYGNPLHHTLTRGTVQCDRNGTIQIQHKKGEVCPHSSNIPQVCTDECFEAVCPQHPNAICVSDPCHNCAIHFVNNLGENVNCEAKCSQEVEKGNCRSTLLRYFFNKSSGHCEEFTYGGCHGNDNNFETKEECQKECEKKEIPVCQKYKDVGKCSAQLIRWFFNKFTFRCEEFFYSGCGGNDNNFETQSECEVKCPDKVFCPWQSVNGETIEGCVRSDVCKNASCSENPALICTVDPCKCQPVFVDKFGKPALCEPVMKKILSTLITAPVPNYTRCQILRIRHFFMGKSAYIPECTKEGGFQPVQCSNEAQHGGDIHCWCVDEAGLQLPGTSTFKKGIQKCKLVKITRVEVTLAFRNASASNLTLMKPDIIRLISHFMKNISAEMKDDIQVEMVQDGFNIAFVLIGSNKVQVAFQLEEMVRMQGISFHLVDYDIPVEYRNSHFYHVTDYTPDRLPETLNSAENRISGVEYKKPSKSWPLILIAVIFVVILIVGLCVLTVITIKRRKKKGDSPHPSLVSLMFGNVIYGITGKKVEEVVQVKKEPSIQSVEAQYDSLQKADTESQISEPPPAYEDVSEKGDKDEKDKH